MPAGWTGGLNMPKTPGSITPKTLQHPGATDWPDYAGNEVA